MFCRNQYYKAGNSKVNIEGAYHNLLLIQGDMYLPHYKQEQHGQAYFL